jgi:Flp pilus assembly protein TadG
MFSSAGGRRRFDGLIQNERQSAEEGNLTMRMRWLARQDESGSLAVIVALSIIAFLGISALVIDLGHAYLVKRQMQAAAEAGACAGANALFPTAGPNANNYNPQWTEAYTAAVNAVKQCYVDGVQLSDFSSANVELGFWNDSWTSSTPPSHLEGYVNAPATPTLPAGDVIPPYFPAVKVYVNKTSGGTGTGAGLATYLASILGFNTMQIQTAGVAARFYPGVIYNAFPFAIPKILFKTNSNGVWVPDTSQIDPTSGQPYWTPYNLPTDGNPSPGVATYTTTVGNGPNGGISQWTSFSTVENGASSIAGLLAADTTVAIANQVWLPSGVKSSDWNAVTNYNCVYNGTNSTVNGVAPYSPVYMGVIVDETNPGSWANVKGFAGIAVTYCTGSGAGGNPYVTIAWVPGYIDPLASGAGPPTTPLTTKIVQ